MTKAITTIIISATLTIWAVWDVYPAFIDRRQGDTISEMIRDVSWTWSIFPLAAGILCGHFFINHSNHPHWFITVLSLILLGLASLILTDIDVRLYPGGVLVVGMALGAVVWPQGAL